jgi:hypothetical protein
MKKSIKVFFYFLVIFSIFYFLNSLKDVQAQAPTVTATVRITVCGNGTIEVGEQCEGTNLGGATCQSLGYASGSLSCRSDCTFNTSSCVSGGGGGGGGGGGDIPPSTSSKVVIQGMAYPNSSITVLQDGRVLATKVANSSANFNVEVANITPGICTFGIWAEDKQGRRSITFNFTTNVLSGMTTTISGIFLPPTIEIDKNSLQRGEILNILGQTAPQSEISISVGSAEIVKETKAGIDGLYFYPFNTAPLEDGLHTARAKATSPAGLLSTFSQTLAFGIGKEISGIVKKADITGDKKVNLVDFSILIYNWGVPKNTAADLNSDNKVNLVDFSIMLYNWTG